MAVLSDNIHMQGMGDRMRERARELGWSDAEVARRLGLAQTRYASYVTDRHEPDLGTFVRVCLVLGVSPDWLLGTRGSPGGQALPLVDQITATARALDPASLAVVATVTDALLARSRVVDDVPAAQTTLRAKRQTRSSLPG